MATPPGHPHPVEFVSPYNDLEVVAGQGTLGLEILDQCPDLDFVFVAVGGGGLVAGVAAAIKASRPEVRIVGCQPAASPVMSLSVEAGQIVEYPSLATLSEATAGGVEAGAVTFPLCDDLVDTWCVLSEEEIKVKTSDFGFMMIIFISVGHGDLVAGGEGEGGGGGGDVSGRGAEAGGCGQGQERGGDPLWRQHRP